MAFSEEFCQEMILNAGFGLRYSSKTLNDFKIITKEHTSVKDAMLDYINNFSKQEDNLLLVGGKGSGKTFTASLIAKELYKHRDITLYYTRLHSLFSDIKDGFNQSNTSNIFEYACNVDLLILDEVGSYSLSNYDYQQFFSLIDERYSNELKTIFITNIEKIKDFIEFLNSAISDRVFESIKIINFGQTSIRTNKTY